jgi:hypothetical protein
MFRNAASKFVAQECCLGIDGVLTGQLMGYWHAVQVDLLENDSVLLVICCRSSMPTRGMG